MKYLKTFLFFPDGVKIDFENTKPASDVQAFKTEKTAKIYDHVFLARRIPPSPDTSKIIGHTWK
jgi:hypothetical protein